MASFDILLVNEKHEIYEVICIYLDEYDFAFYFVGINIIMKKRDMTSICLQTSSQCSFVGLINEFKH